MEEYFQSLSGSLVTRFETKPQVGNAERTRLELHLFKEGSRTVLTVEEYSADPSCRWIDDKLIVLGHFACLMQEVVKSEAVELTVITAEGLHGSHQGCGSGSRHKCKWIAFTHIVLQWKDYKVYLGDVEGDDVLTTGIWPPHVPFYEGYNL